MKPPSHPPFPMLELLVLQHRGQEADHAWQWPEGVGQAAFETVLSGLLGADATFLAQARACTLQRMGSGEQPIWVLANASPDLVCSVNSQVLGAGSQLRLEHGDEIELGLTRLLVSLEPSQGLELPPEQALPRPSPSAVAPQRAQGLPSDMAGFALTDLDAGPEYATLAQAERQDLKRSGFGDLISFNPEDIAPVAVTAPAARVHAPAPAPAPASASASASVPAPAMARTVPPSTSGASIPSASEAPDASTSPSYAEKVFNLLAQLRAGADQPEPGQAQGEDPLATLHARYLDKLRNPARADAEDAWQDLVRGAQARQDDPMQQWMQAAGGSPSLDDLLGQPHSIASVMDGLDGLGSADVLAPEPFDSVMHLFAPEYLRAPQQDSLQSLVQHSLPGLTQREHHSMSLDSAMPFVGGEQPYAPSTPSTPSP